jgi:hypothetical protein
MELESSLPYSQDPGTLYCNIIILFSLKLLIKLQINLINI